MKIFVMAAIVAPLMLAMGAAEAGAQPDNAPRAMVTPPRPPRVRATEPGKQISQDLLDFAAALSSDRMYPTAQRWIYGARIGFFGAQEWARDFSGHRWNTALRVDNLVVNRIEGESATATVTYSFETPGDLPPQTKTLFERERNETLQLKLGTDPFGKEKLWQIVPPEKLPPSNEADGLGGLWTSSAYFLAQKQTLEGVNPKSKRSMANLKQLALGVMQFVQDYDERYAFAPEYLQEALMPYVRSKDLFFVPGTLESYSFNANLSDKSLAQLNEVAQTVLFYEGENEMPVFRYDGRAAIGFADGHVKLVSPDEAKTLIWKP